MLRSSKAVTLSALVPTPTLPTSTKVWSSTTKLGGVQEDDEAIAASRDCERAPRTGQYLRFGAAGAALTEQRLPVPKRRTLRKGWTAGKPTDRTSESISRMSAPMKVFRCGPMCNVGPRDRGGPCWKTSRGGSCVGLVAPYGENCTVSLAALAEHGLVRRSPGAVARSAGDGRRRWKGCLDLTRAWFCPERPVGT